MFIVIGNTALMAMWLSALRLMQKVMGSNSIRFFSEIQTKLCVIAKYGFRAGGGWGLPNDLHCARCS